MIMKRNYIIAAVIAFLGIWLLVWVFTHGFIQVSVTLPKDSNITYELRDQSGKTVASATTKSQNFRRFVHTGNYQVLVRYNETSAVAVQPTKGLLRKTTVRPSLQPESMREYIGESPNFCMNYNKILFSYNCSEYGGLTAHIPPDGDLPPTTNTESSDSVGLPVSGLITLNGTTKALMSFQVDAEEGGGGIRSGLYDINSSLVTSNEINLKGPRLHETPRIMPYKDGFLLYTDDFKTVRYYKNVSANPEGVSLTSSSKTINQPREISVYKSTVGLLYNNADTAEHSDEGFNGTTDEQEIQAPEEGNSLFVVNDNGNQKEYEFDRLYTSGTICGQNRLCLINSGDTDIYDISGKSAKLLFSRQKVDDIIALQDGSTVMIVDGMAVGFDESLSRGKILLNYNRDVFCGATQTSDGFVICVIQNNENVAALHVAVKQRNIDSINKKMGDVLKNPSISQISVYKNSIYIAPNYGLTIFDPSVGGYVYEPEIVKETNENINQLFKKVDIDRSRYTVVGLE